MNRFNALTETEVLKKVHKFVRIVLFYFKTPKFPLDSFHIYFKGNFGRSFRNRLKPRLDPGIVFISFNGVLSI